MAFPTLTANIRQSLTEKAATEAADLRTSTESGYVVTRKRFTRVPKVFSITYGPIGSSDKNLLSTHVDSVGATEAFDWTHPDTDVVYSVRYLKRPEFRYENMFWHTSFDLEQV